MTAAMTDTVDDTALTLSRTFKASRTVLWQAWTDPEEVGAWMGPPGATAEVREWDCRPGGRYNLVLREPDGIHPLRGEFLEVVEGERLAMTWIWEHGVLEGLETLLELNFRDAGNDTELTLVHTRLPTPKAREMHSMGWEGCLESLAGHLVSSL